MSEPHVHTWETIGDAEDGSPLWRCACGLYRLVPREARNPSVREDGIAAIQASWLPYVPFLATLQEDRPPERRRRLEVLPILGPRVIQKR